MRLRIFTEPQLGATYETQLAAARVAEEAGFDAWFRSDHYLTMGDNDGLPGPTDSWVTLAGLARETSRIRLGTLLTSATFRHPGPLAIAAAQVDAMSGGRVELGLGAGWYAEEHRAYGIPFPDTRRSAAVVVCCGADDAEVARRAAAIGREVDELKANGARGTPSQLVDRLAEWGEAGADTLYLQVLDLADLDHLRLIGTEVLPAFPH